MSDKELTRQDILDARQIKLQAALVRAQRAAKEVTKSSENKYHGYGYASAEAMIAEARDAIGQAGLAVITEWTVSEGRVNVNYILMHEEGGSMSLMSSTPILPEKGRPADKAEATALTYNLGYFLRGLLLLPRVEKGAEVDDRDDRDHEPTHQPQATQEPKVNKQAIPLNSLKVEFATVLMRMPKDKQAAVREWLQKQDESVETYITAINKMKKGISQKEHEEVLAEMDPYPEG